MRVISNVLVQMVVAVGCTISTLVLQAQASANAYKVALILPFSAEATNEKLTGFLNATDIYSANRIKMNEDAIQALNFYQGFLHAIEQNAFGIEIALHTYDCANSDSVTKIILAKPELSRMDVIIGAVSANNAKLVADFCKRNSILNIQPFTPSKSLTSNNPFHIKLVPTIDAHIDNLFQSIVSDYKGANVIVLSPNKESGSQAAARFDSLFQAHNTFETQKFTYCSLNAKDMLWKGNKTTVGEQLKEGKKNIWIITSFEDAFINGNMRVLYEKRKTHDITVYGMPTWLNGDIIRLDYLNDYSTHLSDTYYEDTTRSEVAVLRHEYKFVYGLEPDRMAYLGYDVAGFTFNSIREYGKDFTGYLNGLRYKGIAYAFDVAPVQNGNGINYYENRYAHVFKVHDYKLELVH